MILVYMVKVKSVRDLSYVIWYGYNGEVIRDIKFR